MKKFILSLFVVLSFVGVNLAIADEGVDDKVDYGVELDAPNLVKLNESWSIGTEVRKGFNDTSIDENWAVYGKVTYSGSIIDVSKSEASE